MEEKDEWTAEGSNRLRPEHLSRVREIIENESAVVVEHSFYRGGRAPHRFVTDDFEELEQYLRSKTSAGDSIYFWRFEDFCRNNNIAITGKIPDKHGKVPKRGP